MLRPAGKSCSGSRGRPSFTRAPTLHSFPIRAVRSPRIGTVAEDFPFERSGDHRSNGLLAGLGPRFPSGEIKSEVRTEDIAPTVLEFFGVPIPSHYEGRSVG